MSSIALKNLVEERTRLFISAGGVAFAVMLVLLLWGIQQGVLRQAGAYVKHTDADLWIVQEGFTDISHGFSVLPKSLRRRIAGLKGVERVAPIRGGATQLRVDGEKASLLVVGYSTKVGIGGPWEWESRPVTPGRGEIVVDETFAETHGLQVGDRLALPDGERKIVGLTAGTNQFINQLAFAPVQDVRSLTRLDDSFNFLAVQTERGEQHFVQRRIERRFDGVTAFSKQQFLENNQREVEEGFQPILYVMVGVAFVVGLAVVGLTIFTATIEKTAEYGMLAAIGASRRQLYGLIVRQAAITSLLGFLLGALLVVPARLLIGELVPKIEMDLTGALFVVVAAGSMLMGLLASYVPIRRVARLDPAMVFRG